MTHTPDLAAWLGAQLDDDEQVARAAMPHPSDDGRWEAGTDNWSAERIDGDGITIYAEGGHTAEQSKHIALWDPARALAEVEAKRRILAVCVADLAQRGEGALSGEVDRPTWDVLLFLAQPFADRPGFRPEWRTGGAGR